MRFFLKRIAFCTLIIFSYSLVAFAEPTVEIEPYTQDEFPSWAQDIRRTEIVTLGSLPFTTLGVTLGYSLYRYASNGFNPEYIPNPFAKSSTGSLSSKEQIGIVLTSVGISAVIGLVDLTIRLIQRSAAKKEAIRQRDDTLIITPLSDSIGDSALQKSVNNSTNNNVLQESTGDIQVQDSEGDGALPESAKTDISSQSEKRTALLEQEEVSSQSEQNLKKESMPHAGSYNE